MVNTKFSNIFKHFQLRQHFENLETFADSIRGWNVDFRQLDPGDANIRVIQVATPTIMISSGIFSRSLEQKGESPPDTWTFAILEESSPDIIWRGQVMSKNTIAVYPPGAEIDAYSPSGFHVLTISIPTDVFKRWASLCKSDNLRTLQPKYRLIHVNPPKLYAIRSAARKFLTEGNPRQLQDFEMIMDFPNIMVDILRITSTIRSKPSVKKRNLLLVSIIAYINAHISEPISLADLCTIAKVSPRMVQYIFMDSFGVSPKQYIQARRLNAVRKDLLHAKTTKRRISDIASDWGFWHMSQFAVDYRQFFKELPSETIARAGNTDKPFRYRLH